MGENVSLKHPNCLDDDIFLALDYETVCLTIGHFILESVELEFSCKSLTFSEIVCSGYKVLSKFVKKYLKCQRKRKQKKCFNCSQTGHVRAKCPYKVAKPMLMLKSLMLVVVLKCFQNRKF